MKASTCNLPSSDQDPQVIDDDGAAATEHGLCEDGADATENDAGAATEYADASALPPDLPAEFLIGIQEGDAHDPVDLMIVFQKNLELVHEAGQRNHKLEQRPKQDTEPEHAASTQQVRSTLPLTENRRELQEAVSPVPITPQGI